jgi:hypothetical protein
MKICARKQDFKLPCSTEARRNPLGEKATKPRPSTQRKGGSGGIESIRFAGHKCHSYPPRRAFGSRDNGNSKTKCKGKNEEKLEDRQCFIGKKQAFEIWEPTTLQFLIFLNHKSGIRNHKLLLNE